MEDLAFLLDVDNTLLDNDQVKLDLAQEIEKIVGPDRAQVFWSIYEDVRRQSDYVDLPQTVQRFGVAFPQERGYATLAAHILGFPYETSLYPGAIAAIAHLRELGPVAVLSDGDPVFQPAKIARAGIAAAVDGNVLIYAHKEQHLGAVLERFPARRHVLIDDKVQILDAAKTATNGSIVTAHVKQGKYGLVGHQYRPADLELCTIAEISNLSAADFRILPSRPELVTLGREPSLF